ncbi:MAG: alpha/beta fold hydrolase [Armatimonadota bacterium]
MRARQPDQTGYVVRDGVRVYYEVHGAGDTTVLLMPTSPIVHSGLWKGQIPYLARHYRVVTFDPRGNGRSDRPTSTAAYADSEYVADALEVMEQTDTTQATVAALCTGIKWAVVFAAAYPERTLGLVAIAPGLPLAAPHPHWLQYSFTDVLDTDEGWAKHNKHYWRRNWRGYVEFHTQEFIPEPHSTKVWDDAIEWGLATDGEPLIRRNETRLFPTTKDEAEELCRRLRCPVLILYGDLDRCQSPARAERMAELTGGALVHLQGGVGHVPNARHPVVVNMLMKEFVDSVAPPKPRRIVWERALQRPRRALFISSSIGLGHVQRDIAVARELRAIIPDLEIHWWAQHPATQVLEAAGERMHPMSHLQALESAHWEEESSQHDLHAFYAFRCMDEIFCANFMLFHDITRETPYDIWIGDEAWEVDYFLHENPELKCAPFVFMTDVIGFLPVDPENDPREIELCADYNAEMIEQRARFPYVRDLSLYIGDYEELPDAPFGPGLPNIRDWARRWFEPVGYIVPFAPEAYQDTEALRARLGYGGGYPLLMAAVGGTAVGRDLLRHVAESVPLIREEVPDARMVMVTGPRIDPREIPDAEGLEKRPYVHNLFEHLACADAAVVQGGLSTTMELVATRRPFAHVPLRRHWEQNHYVDYRLAHYGARHRLDFADATPERLARTFRELLRTPVAYRQPPGDSARRAAKRIASLLVRDAKVLART